MPLDDHLRTNLANWEDRVPVHARSRAYDLAGYSADPGHLSGVVIEDRPYLGDLAGLDVVHLQCHIGTDTVSLARLGARVTGVDFSPSAIAVARRLAADAGAAGEFVEAELSDAPEALGGARFDLVYTTIGVLCWLPRVAAWAEVVAALLRPGGRLYLRDGHPMLATIDHTRTDDLVVRWPYFETHAPQVWTDPTTYTDADAPIAHAESHEWNHGLGEIVQAVLDAGLMVTRLAEHTTVPWPALPGLVRGEAGRWCLPVGRERLPLTFTLEARLPS